MSDDEELIGTVLDGRWDVLELLGRGGMGAVYRARHRHLRTDVAIKVLRDTAGLSPSDVARFYRESELIGKLNHDHIIRVQDTGKTDSGNDFFVMECLRGPNLRTLLHDEGPLSWARTRVIVLQVCDALSAIHSSGVIHRDLKLQNIVLDPRRGRPDFVKLLDFGVAKSLIDDRQRLTQTGIVLGTLPYMAPEYMLGYPPDGRVDIYALGVLAFELLTGRLPTPNSTTNLALLQSQGVPAGAQEVVVRAMMRDPSQRFGDAEAFAAALAASPDEARPGLDQSTTTRFVSPSNGAGRANRLPHEGPHASPRLAITVDYNNRQPPAPAAPEPVIPAAARPLPRFEGVHADPEEAIEAVGSAEMIPTGRVPGSAETTSLLIEAPVAAPIDLVVGTPQRPSMSQAMYQAPLLAASPERPEGPPDGAQLPEATAAPVRPSLAPKLTRRALYVLIVVFTAVMSYTFPLAPSRPGPSTAMSAATTLRGSGTGLGEVSTSEAGEQPPGGADLGSADAAGAALGSAEPDAAPGGAPGGADLDGADPSGADPDGADPSGADPDGADPDGADPDGADPDGAAPDDAAAPQATTPSAPPPMTGSRSYKNKLSKVKSAVKSCKVEGVDALKLSIVIDGPSGKAEVKVLGPALVKDEDSAQCAVKKIAEIEFKRFEGTFSPKPALFDLKK